MKKKTILTTNYFHIKFNFGVEETLIRNKSFWKDLSKGFKLKSVYTTNGKNNIEKAYDDLVLNNKKIDDVIYKKVNNELSDSSKNNFQKAKKLFDLRVEIYKKLVLEEENLKFEKCWRNSKIKKSKTQFVWNTWIKKIYQIYWE